MKTKVKHLINRSEQSHNGVMMLACFCSGRFLISMSRVVSLVASPLMLLDAIRLSL